MAGIRCLHNHTPWSHVAGTDPFFVRYCRNCGGRQTTKYIKSDRLQTKPPWRWMIDFADCPPIT